jgi:NAD(P)-dependent dehydrogenase (short-subunit alcohol dehydrogenase family)
MGLTIVHKSDLTARKRNPRVALVLAGGAVTGGAYKLGGLKALDDFMVNRKTTDFDIYVGLSAGSFLAAPLAGGVTPVEMLNQRWSSVYTWPQNTRNQLAFLQASANYNPSDTVLLQANAYYRSFRQSHVDGNTTDAQPCAAPGLLCFGDNTTPLLNFAGTQVPDVFGSNLGQIDRTSTSANTFGGALQATSTAKVLNHDNHFVIGASIDRGFVRFAGNSELGTIDSNLFVNGTGVLIQQPTADLSPVNLHTRNTYTGIYATDTIDINPNLSLTAGARFNVAQIKLDDTLGTALDSDSRYSHLNPVIGLTYKILPNMTAYAGYSQANRAPTPLELGCSDPAHPCLIDTFLVSDPPLKQVVSYTYEAGLRGTEVIGGYGISKAADFALARNLAVEWGPKNVRINCVAPGLIKTDFARALWEDPQALARRNALTPLRRIGEPDEIGGIVAFLASPAARFMTGQVVVADGGVTIA